MRADPSDQNARRGREIAAGAEEARRRLAAGETEAARDLFEGLLKKAPREAGLWAALAAACEAENDPEAALAAIRRAQALRPDEPALIAAEARHLADLGETAAAAACQDRLIARFPRAVKPRADKAQILQNAGDFEAAEKEYRQALALAPEDGELFRVLAAAGRIAPDSPLIGQMERLWAKRDLPPRSRAHLGFALAKAMEDTGAHDRVFAYLHPANALMRRLHPFDMGAREAEVEDLLRRMGDGAKERGDAGGATGRPIFVTGLPRSGTTLAEQILSAHPDVTAGGELGLFVRAALRRMAGGTAGFPPGALDAAAAEYRRRIGPRLRAAPRFTDKSIQTVLLAGLARTALPGARMIVLDRDPRDTLLSIYKNVFREGRHLYAYSLADLARQYRLHRRILKFWREAAPEAFTEIRYEDIVGRPEPTARALVAAAGLDWNEACLDFTANARSVKTLSAHQVRQPLYSSSVGAWRRYENDLAELLDALGDIGQDGGT